MADETNELPLDVEATLEASQPHSKPEGTLRRGLASLRGVRRSVYMRRSILRVLAMSPEERLTYNPRNGFEEIALNLVNAKGRDGTVAVQVWKEIKETLGERIGSNWKDTVEEREKKNGWQILNNLPTAFHPVDKESEN
jgi:hypothetical protein